MNSSPTARRALSLFAVVFALLLVIGLIEGEGFGDAFGYAALWGSLSAAAYVFLQRFRFMRGSSSCRMCADDCTEASNEEASVAHA